MALWRLPTQAPPSGARLSETLASSWWAATSRHHVHAQDFAALDHDLDVEVAVVGAGLTGLSTAHHLHQAGVATAVVDAAEVGSGATGRNGGMAVPRYKRTFAELERGYGESTAIGMYEAAHHGLRVLREIVACHDLACDHINTGHLTPIDNDQDCKRFEEDLLWLKTRVHDGVSRLLDAPEAARKCGTTFYRAAYLEPRGVSIHPLEYAQGLATALASKGVRIHAGTPALSWTEADDGVVVRTPRARIRARHLVLSTGAYSDLTDAGGVLRRRVVPVVSAVISTEPLSAALRASLLPDGESATDAKRLTNYYRVLRDGSLLFGGRGGASSEAGPRNFERLRRDMVKLFPQLRGVATRQRWYGLVDASLDGLPHIGSLSRRVHFGLGFNGRGLVMATLFGEHLAKRAMGSTDAPLGPMSEGRFESIPLHALRVPAKQAAITWMQCVDILQRHKGARGRLS